MDFADYLETNLSTSRVSGGTQIVIHDDCPFCGASGGRIYVDAEKGIGIDHKCGEGFGAIKFIMAYEGVNLAQAFKLLGGSEDRYASEAQEAACEPVRWWPRIIPLPVRAEAYMLDRGFDRAFCDSMGLIFCEVDTAAEDRTHSTAERVIIPVYDRAGKAIGWQGRDITGKAFAKYIIQPGFAAADSLYNVHSITPGEPAIVVEGVMDAWGWIVAGYRNVVATWGKKISENQVAMLAELNPSKVFVAWDGDAWKQAYDFAENHNHIWDIRIVGMRKKDADEMSKEELELLLEEAPTYTWESRIMLGLE